MNKFEQLLKLDRPIIIDGGLATQLESMGLDIGGALWSATLLESNPRAIVDAHRAYLDAGAEVIISASYQASRQGFMARGHSAGEADRLIASAVDLALTAREEYMADNPGAREPLVAASVGPYGAALHDGSEYTGRYEATVEQLGEYHAQRLALLDGCGADLLAVETIPNFDEARVLCDLLEEVKTPAWIAFACRDEKCLSDGSLLWAAAGLFADHSRVLVVGVNCTPPEYIVPLIAELKSAAPEKAIVVYPNSGETYHSEDNSWSGIACDLDKEFNVTEWYDAGAKLIGGCCRTGPTDVAAVLARVRSA